MRAVIQRVTSGCVSINHQLISEIKTGFVILLGIGQNDTDDDIDWLATKIINLRIFNDNEDKMNLSIKDVGGDILLISQFTLFAQTKKGNRPSFIKSAKPNQAIPLYNKMIKQLELLLEKPIKTGEFGANTQVSLVNDGPVTIVIDTENKE
jgi:D-tyrosyl-tRNA(Tyr) deacylase